MSLNSLNQVYLDYNFTDTSGECKVKEECVLTVKVKLNSRLRHYSYSGQSVRLLWRAAGFQNPVEQAAPELCCCIV